MPSIFLNLRVNLTQKSIYKVGGAVRDEILGLKPHDIDFVAVGYVADDFSHLEQVGKNFPVFLQKDGSELALARVEKKTAKGYNDFEVDTSKVTIEDDLYRRDLTINSMAQDISSGRLIDPYGGEEDLKNKILRHTSEAFIEDPLRVLRVARFQARFPDFSIDTKTQELIFSMRDELKYLQPDRVFKELKKVLLLPTASLFFRTLYDLKVLEFIFPSLYNLTLFKEDNIYHTELNLFEHTMMVLDELKDNNILLKLTALYHDIAKPIAFEWSDKKHCGGHDSIDLVEPLITKDIQIPTKLKKDTLFLIKNHILIYKYEDMKPSRMAIFIESFRKNRDLFENLISFANADNNGRMGIKKESINQQFLLNIFDKISQYSPKSWIDSQFSISKKELSGDSIKQHIHKTNIGIITNG